MTPHDDPVASRLRTLRDNVNTVAVRSHLPHDQGKWRRCCAALDAAADVEEGIQAYDRAPEFSAHDNGYLLVYGLMQCLYVQQDALKVLFDSLGGIRDPGGQYSHTFAWDDYPGMKRVREVRNEACGHPAAGDKESAVHFIMKCSISKAGFRYGSISTETGDQRWRTVDVDLRQLIGDQQSDAIRCLDNMIFRTNARQRLHTEGVRNARVEGCFSFDLIERIPTLPELVCDDRQAALDIIKDVRRAQQAFARQLRQAGSHPNEYFGISAPFVRLRADLNELQELLDESSENQVALVATAEDIVRGSIHLHTCGLDLAGQDTALSLEPDAPRIDWELLARLEDEFL